MTAPGDPRDHSGPGSSPVEDYLDGLLAASAGAPPRQTRHLLVEAEAHLRDATAEAVRSGRSPEDAEREAVERFGRASEVVRQEASRQAPFRALMRPLIGSGLLLGGLAGVAMGVSAIVTAIMGAVGGSTFIVNISSHTYLAPSDCARWLANDPSAQSCYQAALSDWAWEAVAYRAALGVAGAIALAAFWYLRRRWTGRRLTVDLPRSTVDAIAVTVFGVAGVWLAGLGVDSLIVHGHGAGQGLGSAPAMLVVAAVFGVRLVQDLRRAAVVEA